MKFADDYEMKMPQLLRFPAEWEQLKKDTEAATVLPCPFCGGEAVVKLGMIYGECFVLSLACSTCGVQTKNHVSGKVWTGGYFTLSDVLAKAAATWNRRI